MTAPRIAPGTRADVGPVNWTIARLLGLAAGSPPPHIFTTLGRHRRLFRPWLRFAGALMPGGLLPRADTELLILRVAHNCHSEYEWRHHERLARREGLSVGDVTRVRSGSDAPGWSERQALLLRAADELHEERALADATWRGLRPLLSDEQLIELCMLVGHYEMLAMTLNTLGVVPDAFRSQKPPALAALLMRAASRGRGTGA